MTKYLLAGAAAAALTLGAGFAAAQDFKVTLSGEAKFQALFGGQDKSTNTRATDFRSRFRFKINPEAVGLNGALTYGAQVQIDNDGGITPTTNGVNGTPIQNVTQFEAAFTYLQGSFGRVILGQVAPFNDDNGNVTKPQDWIDENDVALGYASAADGRFQGRAQTIAIMGQSTKVRYDSPFISGLKIGVSYTPTNDSNWNFQRSTVAGGPQDAYEIGVLFDSTDKSIADKFGAGLFKASFGYQGAKNSAVGRTNYSAYQAGVQVGYAGFVLGGHYVNTGTSDRVKTDPKKDTYYSLGVGAQYTFTPALMAGVGYTYTEADRNDAGAGLLKTSAISIGAKYTVAKGLDTYASYGYVSTKDTAAVPSYKNSGSVFEIGTVLSF